MSAFQIQFQVLRLFSKQLIFDPLKGGKDPQFVNWKDHRLISTIESITNRLFAPL